MVSLEIELSKYDIQYIIRGSMKSQALVDFVVEFCSPTDKETPSYWIMSVDSASNMKGSGIGIILEGHCDLLIVQEMMFDLRSSIKLLEYKPSFPTWSSP